LHPYLKGASCERELARELKKLGYIVVRAPASGKGSRYTWYPDLIAVRDGRAVFIEVKCWARRKDVFIPKARYTKILWLADTARVPVLLCVKLGEHSEFKCVDYRNPTSLTEGGARFDWRDIDGGRRPGELIQLLMARTAVG
jgi:Holliday junction resolvase